MEAQNDVVDEDTRCFLPVIEMHDGSRIRDMVTHTLLCSAHLLGAAALEWHSQFVVLAAITVEFARTRPVIVGVANAAEWLGEVYFHYHLARFA